jgi:hypothetical protein
MDLKTQIIQEYLTQGVGFIAVVGHLTNILWRIIHCNVS